MAPRRKIASIAAASAVVLYLASIGHVAFVPHVLCEHGELIHATRLEPLSSIGQLPNGPHAGLQSFVPRAIASGSEGHQHCVVASNHRNQLPDPDSSVELLTTQLEPRPPAVAAIAPTRQPAIQLAPKQSPPA
jgi:hypothetical protein